MLSTMASYITNLENLMEEGITAGQPCNKYYVYSKFSLSVVLFLSLSYLPYFIVFFVNQVLPNDVLYIYLTASLYCIVIECLFFSYNKLLK